MTGPRPLVVDLDDDGPDAIDPALVGGKAAALARLVRSGHPVPHGVVLTTEAYRVTTADRIRSSAETDDAAVDSSFDALEVPEPVKSTLARIASAANGPLAVRSSATGEDATLAAFPGQFRSLLDVTPGELEAAVRHVWASLWHRAPREYRRRAEPDDADPAMAVIVMDMVDAEVAGVLFTCDPVGAVDDLRVELVTGTAEGLVGGEQDPIDLVVPRRSASTAATARLGPAIGRIVGHALAVEDEWGTPIDLEFAVGRDGRPWIVQARPITTVRTDARYDRNEMTVSIDEMLPGRLPPLLVSTAARHVEEGLRYLFADLGADIAAAIGSDRRFIEIDDSRALLDDSVIRRAAATVPRAREHPGRIHGLGGQWRVARIRSRAILESQIVIRAVDHLAADPPHVPGDATVGEVLSIWERIQDLGARITAIEIAVAACAVAAHDGVRNTIARQVGAERADELARTLTTPNTGAGPLDRCLGAGPEGTFDERLTRSGSRNVFGGPTWADEPDLARLAASPLDRHVPVEPSDLPNGSAAPRRFIAREAAAAATLLDRRERSKIALLDLGGIAHRTTIRLGESLAGDGVIDRADDVWSMTHAELRRACVDGIIPDDLAARRDIAARSDRVGPPKARGVSNGRPASPGLGHGPAVILDGRNGPVPPGSVLVAHSSDASWTPLLRTAAAIVVETGSTLSHAAILARELGVPAVVGRCGIVDEVRAAAHRTDGSVELTVDGSTGRVTLHPATPISVVTVPLPTVEPPTDEQRLGVFVTGLVGASAVFLAINSLIGSVADRRAVARTARRAEAPARLVAESVRCGSTAARRTAVAGLPTTRAIRHGAAVAGIASLSFAAASIRAGIIAEERRRVLWLAGALPVAALGASAVVIGLRSVRRWPDVEPFLRRAVGVVQATFPVGWRDLPRRHRRALSASAIVAVSLLAIAIASPGLLDLIDRPVYEAVGAPSADPWGPDWFEGVFGRRQIVIPAALAMIMSTIRCRVLATAFATTIVFGGLANLGLGALVGRHRPLLGEHPGRADSFPSGHAVEVTLLLGLLPLAVAVATRSRWAGRTVRVVSGVVLAVMLVDGVRDGSHWPIDHLAGFCIAMCAVVLVHAVAATAGAHVACADCPTLDGRRRAQVEP